MFLKFSLFFQFFQYLLFKIEDFVHDLALKQLKLNIFKSKTFSLVIKNVKMSELIKNNVSQRQQEEFQHFSKMQNIKIS